MTKTEQKNPTLEFIIDKFPLVFFREKKQVRPLKIGIFDDLKSALPDIDEALLHRAIRKYCAKARYQTALANGHSRIDLNGDVVSEVSEEIRQKARVRLEKMEELKDPKLADEKRREKRRIARKRNKLNRKHKMAELEKFQPPKPPKVKVAKPAIVIPLPPPQPIPKKSPTIIVKKKRTITL